MTFKSTLTNYLILLLLFATAASCKTKKELVTPVLEPDMLERMLDSVVVTPEGSEPMDTLPKVYNTTAPMVYDILHTALDLRFDWNKQHVIGKADLTIKPYFEPIKVVKLDAVGFEIKSVKVNNTAAKYNYDDKSLIVELGTNYTRKDKFVISVDYIAKPNENKVSGSDAITSDKGLFFIDPLGTDPDMPSQIWTQGETENNSRWFPTFDKPNERFTQEIKLTIEDKYTTLSNGLKISSRKNTDGTRTDHWKQDKPHAPYLAMIAIGEFHEEMDQWEGKPVHYLVEKGWAKYAKKIYNHTPEMLSFFSSKLDYPYPWDKYAQVIVKEYVSGAMENTSAVIFGDFVQKTEREMIDNDNDVIVAHEMMHHWFGDLVTCEDWSNLTLNEGFANYAEYLWQEHKYGRDRAEYHRLNELNGYLSASQSGVHPLIHYFYKNKEEMFDAHSYNKGGLVLHMLRSYLGDDAFFAGLNKYLVDNAYTAVEVDELRMAFEDTTGEDLHWFFDQWFLGQGHPMFKVKYDYNKSARTLTIDVDQSETPVDYHQPFIVPFDVAIYYPGGKVVSKPVKVTKMKEQFVLDNIDEPLAYVLDGKNVVLGLFDEVKSTDAVYGQFMNSPHLYDKVYAYSLLNNSPEGQRMIASEPFIDKALADPSNLIRMIGIQSMGDSLMKFPKYLDKLEKLAVADKHSEVRNAALYSLTAIEDYDPINICTLVMESEQSYPVLSTAISILGGDQTKALKYFERYKNEPSDNLASAFAQTLESENDDVLTYFESKAKKISTEQLMDFYGAYGTYLSQRSIKTIARSVDVLQEIAGDSAGNIYRKYMAIKTLSTLDEVLQGKASTESTAAALSTRVQSLIKEIVAKETSPMLRAKYGEEFGF